MNKAKRNVVIAGNWKMNMTPAQTTEFITALAPMVAGMDGCKVVLCVPYVDIAAAVAAAEGTNIEIGAENVHMEAKGAYTGEISGEMLELAEKNGVNLLLPVDTVIAKDFPNPIDAEIAVTTVASDAIPADMQGLDIGEKTRELFADAVKNAKTVVWNGPMGVFENPTLAKGTIAVAQALADSDAITIVGGGDSAAACEQLGFASQITHISTGGGASLELLEGLELPGIACLENK